MSAPFLSRVVADVGNSRLKWGRVDERGQVGGVVALAIDAESAWGDAWEQTGLASEVPGSWAIASVNPPVAERLETFLKGRGVGSATWYRSVADVPLRHGLENPETAGADRALAVVGALEDQNSRGPGLVVLCGTAVTVERISADGTWQGGAIASGMGLSSRALHLLTAQLPRVEAREAPPAWGNATRSALEAGIYWGVVGAIRELLTRQAEGLSQEPWVVWTGGDAAALSRGVAWEGAKVVPDLVLRGLAAVGFKDREG